MILVITGTIKPEKQKNLVIANEEERLTQYIDSIEFFRDSGAFDKIVFCENSNYSKVYKQLIEIGEKISGDVSNRQCKIEVLQFQGNSEMVKSYGKGYGEGEIMEYLFHNSILMQEELKEENPYFLKITGRLKVINIKKITDSINRKIGKKNLIDCCYFNIPNHTRRDIYDTRFYGMSIKNYQTYFIKAYKKVDDENGIFYEHIFTEIIRKNKLIHKNFPYYPRILGVSGSFGGKYVYTEWKCKIKDGLSKLEFYS